MTGNIKKISLIILILLGFLFVGCNDDDDDDKKSSADFTLQLLHMSDVDGSNAEAIANAGNFARNITAFKVKYPDNTLFLSSGDNYIPGSRYDAGANEAMAEVDGIKVPGKGRADIAMLNAMGLQASAVGNHDLDGGTSEFASIIGVDGEYPGAQFPYLSSNLIFAADEKPAPFVKEDGEEAKDIPNSLTSSAVIEVNGEKIGIVGATTPTEEVIATTGGITVLPANDSTEELAALIQAKVDALTATGINKVILLAHMQTLSIEKSMALLLKDVDIIVAGGSNTRLSDDNDRIWAGDESQGEYPLQYTSAKAEPVLIVNVDGDYKYIGRLVVGFDKNGLILTGTLDDDVNGAYVCDNTMAESLGGEVIAQVDAVVTALNNVIIASEENIIGNTSVWLNGIKSQVRSEETNLGNLTADANLWYAKLLDSEVSVSIRNGGGIRASIGYAIYPPGSTNPDDLMYLPPAAYPAAGKEDGDISQFDLQSALAFNNSLAIVEVTAHELKEIIEHAVAEVVPADATGYGGGRFTQVAGISFTYNPNLTARTANAETGEIISNGKRIIELKVGNDTVVSQGVMQGDENRTFNVITLGYLADGGDGYPFPDNKIDSA